MLPDDRGFDDASDFDDDIYDGEGESDIDSEYLEDDSDFEIKKRPMERIPPAPFSSIVVFAVYDYSEDLVLTKRKLPVDGFKSLALVSNDVSSAMKGCPALDDLEIELYHPAGEDETEYNDPYNAGTVDFPEHEVLNIDIYDDKFCETLVKHCPLLTKFSIWEVAEGHNSNLTPIRTFTDQGLVALAKLKYLTALELRTINCTGNGVFEFLNELSDEFVGHRTFQICVELLMQLEAISPEELGEQYLRGLEPVVNNVKKMHPNLRLRITTSGRRGSTFRSIIELGLYTSNVEPSLWYGWDDEDSDRNITFVNRGGGTSIFDQGRNRLPVELRHPELLDPDSLPIDYELPADYFDDYGYGGYGDFDDYCDDEDDDGYYDGNADELWANQED
ncbi:hypothetical protein JG688_00017002 [Phytophthora aleatoria]|uniref:Uncharacterized protein n=1 Tax=Phytophthora aleatoria TaxID=2496075 RepID=A0A8J5II43_9STRA|nr:hypothetical protein JG688_00017002 [Phytophthora aleatoria]